MAILVSVSGPRASGDEPDRQERQVERRNRPKRLVHSAAGIHHFVAGKMLYFRRRRGFLDFGCFLSVSI